MPTYLFLAKHVSPMMLFKSQLYLYQCNVWSVSQLVLMQ